MSLMYISEYTDVGRINGTQGMIGAEPAVDQTPVAFTATAGQSAAFKNNTTVVRIHVDGLANILFGTNPTAVTVVNKRMAAGQTEYFSVPMGQAYKVSAVTST